MKQIKCENNTISYKKSEFKLITDAFREIIRIYSPIYNKKRLSTLRRAIRGHEKIVIDKKEDDTEYLQDRINYLNSLKNRYLKQNQYQDKNANYHGIETIRYLFNDDDEDYNLYPTNYQQYQSFFDKTLLPLNEYLEKIRPELIRMSKNCNISADTVFRSIRNSNDLTTLQIKSENTTNIDEMFDQLIKKHETHSKSLKDINFKPEGIESMIYNFTETIISNTFIESVEWIKNKKCTINPQNKDNKRFQYSVTIVLNYQKVKNHPERISKIKPFINNLNWDNTNFPPQEQDYKTFEVNNKSIALNVLQINEQKISQY